jgi:RNA polymerase sigma-70 factor (ECF subfamily)
VVAISDGQLLSVLGVTIRRGKIVEIDILADRERLAGLVVENLD